jgi:hypothetical protein
MGTPTAVGTHSASGIVSAIPRWRTEPRHADMPATEYACLVPADTVRKLTAFAERPRVPVDSVLLAAHAKVLAALSGERDVLTGYSAPGSGGASRPCGVELEDGDWRQLVRAADSAAHREPPPPSTARTYEVVLDLSRLDGSTTAPTGPELTAPGGPVVLHITFAPAPDGGLRLRPLGRAEVVDLPYARRVAGHLLTVLELMAVDDTAGHHTARILSPDELTYQTDGLAGPHRPLPDRRAHELFEERVREHPDRIAAAHEGAEWSCAALNRYANRVAHTLLARGLKPEDVVASAWRTAVNRTRDSARWAWSSAPPCGSPTAPPLISPPAPPDRLPPAPPSGHLTLLNGAVHRYERTDPPFRGCPRRAGSPGADRQ